MLLFGSTRESVGIGQGSGAIRHLPTTAVQIAVEDMEGYMVHGCVHSTFTQHISLLLWQYASLFIFHPSVDTASEANE